MMLLKFSRKTYQTLQAREEYVTYFLIKFRYSPCSKTKQTHGLMESFFFFNKKDKELMKVKLQACLVLISGSRICSMSDVI